jgi:hypothetical protein
MKGNLKDRKQVTSKAVLEAPAGAQAKLPAQVGNAKRLNPVKVGNVAQAGHRMKVGAKPKKVGAEEDVLPLLEDAADLGQRHVVVKAALSM